jgi:hypothetical protein
VKKNESGKSVVTLKKPVNFEGNEVTEISMDLESLTGRDISSIKSEWAMAGKFSPVPAADIDFCILAACRASGQPAELFDLLGSKDYMRVSQEVSNFFNSPD